MPIHHKHHTHAHTRHTPHTTHHTPHTTHTTPHTHTHTHTVYMSKQSTTVTHPINSSIGIQCTTNQLFDPINITNESSNYESTCPRLPIFRHLCVCVVCVCACVCGVWCVISSARQFVRDCYKATHPTNVVTTSSNTTTTVLLLTVSSTAGRKLVTIGYNVLI